MLCIYTYSHHSIALTLAHKINFNSTFRLRSTTIYMYISIGVGPSHLNWSGHSTPPPTHTHPHHPTIHPYWCCNFIALHPKCLNKSLAWHQNIYLNKFKSRALHLQMFEQKSCIASSNVWTKVLLCTTNVWTKVFLRTHNGCTKV